LNSQSLYLFWLQVHFISVLASVSLFATRGLAVLLQKNWPMQTVWRVTSVLIDIMLLIAGLTLWWLISHNPMHEPWLAVKLILLPIYIALGTMALKKADNTPTRLSFYLAALACAGYMFMTGLTRNALWWMQVKWMQLGWLQ